MRLFKFLLFFLLVFLSLPSWALEIEVKSFEEKPMQIMDASIQKRDGNDSICALVKVILPEDKAEFEGNVVDSKYKTTEYWVYLTPGTKHLNVKYPHYEPLMVNFADSLHHGLESKKIYELKLSLPPLPISAEDLQRGVVTVPVVTTDTIYVPTAAPTKPIAFSKHNQGYVDLFFQAGQNMAVGAAVGGYFHAINAEIEFAKGISKSDKIFWYKANEMVASDSYSSWSWNVKLGYGFRFKERFQVTPQFGVGTLQCTSPKENPAHGANAVFGLVGCRGSFTFAKHLQVTLAPYYSFTFKKSSSFEEISALQPSIGHWAGGFNVKIAITAFI